jgi:hypothetical protein
MLNALVSSCAEVLILKNDPAPLKAIAPITSYFDMFFDSSLVDPEILTPTVHSKFLGCFGKNREDQEKNFRDMVDVLKAINLEFQSAKISSSDPKAHERYLCDKYREAFSKNSEFLRIARNICELCSTDSENIGANFLEEGFAAVISWPAGMKDLLDIMDPSLLMDDAEKQEGADETLD